MGGEGVLSTPSMIGLMERAGIQAVQPHLPEGHTTVGFEVNVKHFGATPKGQKVTVRAELMEVEHPSQRDHSGAEEGVSRWRVAALGSVERSWSSSTRFPPWHWSRAPISSAGNSAYWA